MIYDIYLGDDDGVVLGDVGGLVQAPQKLLLAVRDVHRRAREHVRRPDKHRVAH